jgi:predicted Zn-dependent protease with MMP-like domain
MTDDDNKFYAPDAAFILALSRAAIDSLPDTFRTQARTVDLEVQDFIADDQLEDLGLEDPYELTTLFKINPDTVCLFRRPLLDEWVERGDICLADLVMHILVQDLADHFGWTDAEVTAHPSLSVVLRTAQRRLTEREG